MDEKKLYDDIEKALDAEIKSFDREIDLGIGNFGTKKETSLFGISTNTLMEYIELNRNRPISSDLSPSLIVPSIHFYLYNVKYVYDGENYNELFVSSLENLDKITLSGIDAGHDDYEELEAIRNYIVKVLENLIDFMDDNGLVEITQVTEVDFNGLEIQELEDLYELEDDPEEESHKLKEKMATFIFQFGEIVGSTFERFRVVRPNIDSSMNEPNNSEGSTFTDQYKMRHVIISEDEEDEDFFIVSTVPYSLDGSKITFKEPKQMGFIYNVGEISEDNKYPGAVFNSETNGYILNTPNIPIFETKEVDPSNVSGFLIENSELILFEHDGLEDGYVSVNPITGEEFVYDPSVLFYGDEIEAHKETTRNITKVLSGEDIIENDIIANIYGLEISSTKRPSFFINNQIQRVNKVRKLGVDERLSTLKNKDDESLDGLEFIMKSYPDDRPYNLGEGNEIQLETKKINEINRVGFNEIPLVGAEILTPLLGGQSISFIFGEAEKDKIHFNEELFGSQISLVFTEDEENDSVVVTLSVKSMSGYSELDETEHIINLGKETLSNKLNNKIDIEFSGIINITGDMKWKEIVHMRSKEDKDTLSIYINPSWVENKDNLVHNEEIKNSVPGTISFYYDGYLIAERETQTTPMNSITIQIKPDELNPANDLTFKAIEKGIVNSMQNHNVRVELFKDQYEDYTGKYDVYDGKIADYRGNVVRYENNLLIGNLEHNGLNYFYEEKSLSDEPIPYTFTEYTYEHNEDKVLPSGLTPDNNIEFMGTTFRETNDSGDSVMNVHIKIPSDYFLVPISKEDCVHTTNFSMEPDDLDDYEALREKINESSLDTSVPSTISVRYGNPMRYFSIVQEIDSIKLYRTTEGENERITVFDGGPINVSEWKNMINGSLVSDTLPKRVFKTYSYSLEIKYTDLIKRDVTYAEISEEDYDTYASGKIIITQTELNDLRFSMENGMVKPLNGVNISFEENKKLYVKVHTRKLTHEQHILTLRELPVNPSGFGSYNPYNFSTLNEYKKRLNISKGGPTYSPMPTNKKERERIISILYGRNNNYKPGDLVEYTWTGDASGYRQHILEQYKKYYILIPEMFTNDEGFFYNEPLNNDHDTHGWSYYEISVQGDVEFEKSGRVFLLESNYFNTPIVSERIRVAHTDRLMRARIEKISSISGDLSSVNGSYNDVINSIKGKINQLSIYSTYNKNNPNDIAQIEMRAPDSKYRRITLGSTSQSLLYGQIIKIKNTDNDPNFSEDTFTLGPLDLKATDEIEDIHKPLYVLDPILGQRYLEINSFLHKPNVYMEYDKSIVSDIKADKLIIQKDDNDKKVIISAGDIIKYGAENITLQDMEDLSQNTGQNIKYIIPVDPHSGKYIRVLYNTKLPYDNINTLIEKYNNTGLDFIGDPTIRGRVMDSKVLINRKREVALKMIQSYLVDPVSRIRDRGMDSIRVPLKGYRIPSDFSNTIIDHIISKNIRARGYEKLLEITGLPEEKLRIDIDSKTRNFYVDELKPVKLTFRLEPREIIGLNYISQTNDIIIENNRSSSLYDHFVGGGIIPTKDHLYKENRDKVFISWVVSSFNKTREWVRDNVGTPVSQFMDTTISTWFPSLKEYKYKAKLNSTDKVEDLIVNQLYSMAYNPDIKSVQQNIQINLDTIKSVIEQYDKNNKSTDSFKTPDIGRTYTVTLDNESDHLGELIRLLKNSNWKLVNIKGVE